MRELALVAAARAYCHHGDEVLAGCALRMKGGAMITGTSVNTWTGYGGLSPLEVALTALAARGKRLDEVTEVAWAHGPCLGGAELTRMRQADLALCRDLLPNAQVDHE